MSDRPGIQTQSRLTSTKAVYRGIGFGVRQAGGEQVVERPEGLDPLRRSRFDGESVEDSAGDGDRGRAARGSKPRETGAQAGERLDPLPGLLLVPERRRGASSDGRDPLLDERQCVGIAGRAALVQDGQRAVLIDRGRDRDPNGPEPWRRAPKNPNLTPNAVAVMITAPTKMPATLRLARRRSGMVASVQDWNLCSAIQRRFGPGKQLVPPTRATVRFRTDQASIRPLSTRAKRVEYEPWSKQRVHFIAGASYFRNQIPTRAFRLKNVAIRSDRAACAQTSRARAQSGLAKKPAGIRGVRTRFAIEAD